MIGIICAEQEELNAIIKIAENTKTVKFKSFEFILGKILNKECVKIFEKLSCFSNV